MKRIAKICIVLSVLLLIVGGASNVTAAAVGEGYDVGGVGIGWIMIGVSLFFLFLGLIKVIDVDIMKKVWVPLVVVLLIGAVLQFVQVPEADTGAIADECPDFEVTGSAVTTPTNYIEDTTWDEDTLTLTVPLTVADSSDGNLTGHIFGLNLTFDPIGSGHTSEEIVTIFFNSDYTMKYGGEYLLDEDSTGYKAIWTTTEGTEYYDDSIDITADSSDWAQIDYTFVNGTAGSWVTELDQIGDSKTWYISLANDCGTWTETITVVAIVVSYTA